MIERASTALTQRRHTASGGYWSRELSIQRFLIRHSAQLVILVRLIRVIVDRVCWHLLLSFRWHGNNRSVAMFTLSMCSIVTVVDSVRFFTVARTLRPNFHIIYIILYIYELLFQTRLTRIHAQWSIDNNTW